MVIEPAPSISKGGDSMLFPGLRKITQRHCWHILTMSHRGYLWIILSMSFLSRDSAEFPGPDPINQ